MKRETIAYERILYYMGNTSHMSFAFRIKVNSNVDKNRLERALSSVQKKHTLARIRVEMTADKKQFITTENVPEIPLRELTAEEADWKAILKIELCRRFDIFKGPMIRVFLIQNKNTSDIIVVFHHAICDGLSAVIFLEDLFSFLAEPGLPLNPCPEMPVFTNLIKKDILDIINAKEIPEWLKNRDIPDLKPPQKEPPPEPDFAIHNWSFGEEETNKIASFAKENNVSVHAILGAVLLRAFSLELKEKNSFKGVLQSPVSFRPFMIEETKDYFGLFIGIFKADVDCSQERTIPEIALEIYTKLKAQLNNYEPLIGYYFFNKYSLDGIEDPELFYANRKVQPVDYDFSLSNLGRIQIQKKYGNYDIEEIYGPIFSAIKGEVVISVTTHQERMFFTCIYDKKCFDYATGSTIIQKALDIFKNIILY